MFLKNIFFQTTHWETWDWRIKYIPLVPFWAWHCIRSRSFWFFTPSNPTLTFGGFEGEAKKEIYKHLPKHFYPKSIYISPKTSYSKTLELVIKNFDFPFAVKPDVGRMGFMFRIINNLEELKLYHETMPVDYIVQDLIKYPLEVSVFYYRYPADKKGTITGFIKKEFLEVVGDGKSTLLQLMLDYQRIRFRLDELKIKHKEHLNIVIAKGHVFYLSYALNLSRGGKLVSLEQEKDERLLQVFDEISLYSKTLFYGRYDIKCSSIEELKQGKKFSILEYNGCGAEPHHVYGNGYTLFQACKILEQHWSILARIARQNNKIGIRYWAFRRGWIFMKQCRKHYAILRKIDSQFPVS